MMPAETFPTVHVCPDGVDLYSNTTCGTKVLRMSWEEVSALVEKKGKRLRLPSLAVGQVAKAFAAIDCARTRIKINKRQVSLPGVE